MLLRKGASICRRWRQQRRQVPSLARSASGASAQDDLNLQDLAEQKKKPSASNTDTLFGIAPIKVRDDEDEDFVPQGVPLAPTKVPPSSSPASENYFSKTWEMQKSKPLNQAMYFLEHDLTSPSQPAHPPFAPNKSTINRMWQVASDSEACTQETFTFASLKVLSEAIAHRHKTQLYRRVPLSVLDWKSRRRKLLAELDQLAADIICLQELDKFQDLQTDLAFKGYAGMFKASDTGRAPTGCAIFWRQKRFELLYAENIDFGLLDMRSNVAQLCVLQSTVPGTADNEVKATDSGNHDHNQRNRIIVGNIEVLFNPRRGEVKLGQCRTFLYQTRRLANQWPGTPLVIGGCFHATPTSAIYQLLAESKVDVSGLKTKYISGHLQRPAETPAAPVTSSGIKSAFDMYLSGNSTKDISAAASGSASPWSPVQKDDATAKAFISKTVEILESCAKSQAAEVVRDENLIGMNAPLRNNKVPEAETDSASSYTVAETAKQVSSGSAMISYPSPADEAPKEAHPEEAPSLINVTTDNASCDSEVNGSREGLSPEINKTSAIDSESVMPLASTADQDSKLKKILDCFSPVNEAPKHDSLGSPDRVSPTTCHETSADLSGLVSTPEHGWAPEDLIKATGSKDCTVIKHDLKLYSVYPEIRGEAMTRDSKGEPCMTMAHEDFKGTVDYIWRSEGLKTMKVLDTLSMNEMLLSPSVPFLISGSDHISLACQLSFSSPRLA